MKKIYLGFFAALGLILANLSFAATVAIDTVAMGGVGGESDYSYMVGNINPAEGVAEGDSMRLNIDMLTSGSLKLSGDMLSSDGEWLLELWSTANSTLERLGFVIGSTSIMSFSTDLTAATGTYYALLTVTKGSFLEPNNITTIRAQTPIPAALLLFGSAFIGLFGVKSYSRKKLAA